MISANQVKPHMPVVCSKGGQFAVVDHMEGQECIKLQKDDSGHHHYIPLSWVTSTDNGQLKVTIRNGRMLIVLPNDVLFDSGKTDLKPAGKAALTQVAQALATIGDRRFLVAGHTDNAPIKTARFPSNWELSTARAVEVARLLIAGGIKPQVLGAAGYAEFDPVASNDDPVTKAQNRRIEIILEPNLSDLPNLESLITETRK